MINTSQKERLGCFIWEHERRQRGENDFSVTRVHFNLNIMCKCVDLRLGVQPSNCSWEHKGIKRLEKLEFLIFLIFLICASWEDVRNILVCSGLEGPQKTHPVLPSPISRELKFLQGDELGSLLTPSPSHAAPLGAQQ